MSKKRAVIFANGTMCNERTIRSMITATDTLIAANGGFKNMRKLGLTPRLMIGDLDSLDARTATLLQKSDIEIIQHPREKDQTDLELALNEAIDRGFQDILVIAATGGRLDQTLANVDLLANYAGKTHIHLENGLEEVCIIHNKLVINGHAGDMISLIPLDEIAYSVTTKNLKYPLKNEDLSKGSTRGISNVMLAKTASVQISQGGLLCVHTRKNGDEKCKSPS